MIKWKREMQESYNLYLDDSVNMKNYLMTDDFKNKTIFFLDAHVDNMKIYNYIKEDSEIVNNFKPEMLINELKKLNDDKY